MAQLSFGFDSPPKPPHSGSETSRAAAESIKPNAGTLRAMVLEFIEAQGERGATDDEIQRALGMEGNTERPRRQELEKMGLIWATDKTRETSSGRQATVWQSINRERKVNA